MQRTEPRQVLRGATAVVITMVIAVPAAFIMIAMSVVVHEAVIRPTAVLGTSVVASLIGSWAADGLSRDGRRTLVNQVVARSLLWGLIPAALISLTTFLGTPVRPVVWGSLVVAYASVVGVILAFRHRSEETPPPARTLPTFWWLAGTVAAVAVVIFMASLFGLTGA